MTKPSGQSDDNTYILGHTATEQVRLTEQDRHFTEAMGGLLVEQEDLSGIHRVLDVACGPGGWALEMAEQHPNMQIVGVDVDAGMISYATRLARASNLNNVTFHVMNVLDPLDFPDATFDLVNARFMVGFLPIAAWPGVLQEFARINRSGGTIRLTEQEWTGCSSLAYETAQRLTFRSSVRAGVNFAADARHIGITPRLHRLLKQAGYTDIQETVHAIDFSSGTSDHHNICQDLIIAQHLMQPFKIGMGVAVQDQLDQLQQQMSLEMPLDNFYGIMYLLTSWGKKP